MSNNDHFSSFAATYATYRPTYPAGLFTWLADQAPARQTAWDCATGNGQAALALAEHFDAVVATDVGARMIAHAPAHPRVTYAVEPAEKPPGALAPASVDLVTVAQALHWFDLPRFWSACTHVIRPTGILAYWGYLLPEVTPAVDAIVRDYHDNIVGPYWSPDRAPLLEGYRRIQPPGTCLNVPDFTMTATWNVDQLIGTLDSWSATHRCRQATKHDPLPATAALVRAVWGPSPTTRDVTWPLHVHAWRW